MSKKLALVVNNMQGIENPCKSLIFVEYVKNNISLTEVVCLQETCFSADDDDYLWSIT